MQKVWCVNKETGYGCNFLRTMVVNAKHIPEPLPWIDPSVNCLYQESVMSFIVGNYECCIMSLCSLLEHTLRAAIIDPTDTGMLRRKDTESQISKMNTLNKLINNAKGTSVMSGCDIDWWIAVSSIIRNKIAHYDLKELLKKCATSEKLKSYIDEFELPENNDSEWYNNIITNWGSFYHQVGGDIAEGLLRDSSKELKQVISNTTWSGDESWWKSLKEHYDAFFKFVWTPENIIDVFQKSYMDIEEKNG